MKDFDAREPNVMQSLVYWVACSMGLTGAEHPAEKFAEKFAEKADETQANNVIAPESTV
jgi:hypothetical protein